MKKTILFGALAFLAVSALGIQDVNAQNEEKVKAKKVESVSEKQEKPSAAKIAQEPVKKTDDCCADKKVSADKKKNAECCDAKKAEAGKKMAAEKRGKADRRAMKADDKIIRKHDADRERKHAKKAPGKRVKSEK